MSIELLMIMVITMTALIVVTTAFWFQMQTLRARRTLVFLRARPDMDPLDKLIAPAKEEVLMIGISFANVLPDARYYILDKAKQGVVFKFLLLDPSLPASDTIIMSIAEQVGAPSAYILINDIKIGLNYLKSINEILDSEGFREKLEVRLTQVVPSMTVVMVDPSSKQGKIRVELHPYAAPVALRPSFDLERARDADRKFYDIFFEQYLQLWHMSTPIETIETAWEEL